MMKMAFRLMEGRLMGDFEWCCCYMRESLYEGTWGGIGRKSPGDGSNFGLRVDHSKPYTSVKGSFLCFFLCL
jgi:hypothetical protein